MKSMQPALKPEQVAKMFGCTIEQARAQIEHTAKQCRADEDKAKASKNGKLRGLSAAWYADRAAAFEAVL